MCCPAGKPLTKQQLLPEIGAFILAGFDTSSHTIAWCL
jgi:cytochrome P450